MCIRASRNYTVDRSLPSKARDFGIAAVMALLPVSSWDGADDLASVMSELANEALRNESSTCDVAVDIHRGFIEVTARYERGDTRPAGGADPGAELSSIIVQSLTVDRGTRRMNNHVEMWAIIECDVEATAHIQCQRDMTAS